jgi:hypothetical protein
MAKNAAAGDIAEVHDTTSCTVDYDNPHGAAVPVTATQG